MKQKSKPDYVLAGLVICLVLLGILILSSVSALYSWEKYNKTTYFLTHQLFFAIIPGLIAGFIAFKIPLEKLKKYAPIFLLINLVFLAYLIIYKFASGSSAAARWITIGSFSLQPSEFLKITFVLYLASWISSRWESTCKNKILAQKPQKKGLTYSLIPFCIIIAVITLFLALQPDISTLGVIVLVGILVYWTANTPIWHTLLIFLAGAGGFALLIKIAPYRLNRFLVFLRPETDPMGIGYQIKQALIAVGSGGIFGQGLGMSQQKFGFLPQSMSDSIFAVFAEETGLIGSLILVIIFLMIFWRGLQISKKAPDNFSQLTALGITLWFSIQAFVNIGAMIGILPLTGIPLPFISYGGSHLIAELVGAGILLNISRQR